MTNQILGNTEFKIVKFKRDILIRDNDKRYIMMFKYEGSEKWAFGLPVKTMYLGTIADCKKSIQHAKSDPNTNKYKCEYQIAEIVN